jgi:hypothetical protein
MEKRPRNVRSSGNDGFEPRGHPWRGRESQEGVREDKIPFTHHCRGNSDSCVVRPWSGVRLGLPPIWVLGWRFYRAREPRRHLPMATLRRLESPPTNAVLSAPQGLARESLRARKSSRTG